MNRAPRPSPALVARMRPPWASTSPLQMARPRPRPGGRAPRVTCACGMLAEQAREPVRRDAAAAGRKRRSRHGCRRARAATWMGVDSGACRAALERQVVQDLDDALPVHHHAGHVLGGRSDVDRVPAAPAQERVPRAVHQCPRLRGLRRDRQCARSDAPRIQQVADEAAHVIGLLVDDAEELQHFGRSEARRGGEHRGRRALDGGERRAQLVAHDRQELGPHPLELLEWRQILHRYHDRLDPAPSGAWIGVALTSIFTLRPSGTESTISSVRSVSARLRCLRHREVRQGDLTPVGPLARHHLHQLLHGSDPASCSPSDNPLALPGSPTRYRPVLTSKTTTPTGEVSTRASRFALARCSSR